MMRYTGRACYHRLGLPQQGFQRRRPRHGGLAMVAYNGAHVVVTGGTGALGTAVVGALRAAGAVCHVTNIVPAELEKFPHRDTPGVHVATGIDLADEAAVRRFYASLPPLWASIHLAGGFAMSPAAETSKVDFVDQFQMNVLSAFLCSA